MSKTINNFVVSFVLVLFSLFGLSACAGPLDNLKVTVSSNAIHEVEGGFEATLTLGDPTTDRINIQAIVDGAGGDVSSQVLWQSEDTDKVEVVDKKFVGDKNSATIVGKNVTVQGQPIKVTISSIEKTSACVNVFVNVVAKATQVQARNNTAIAVKNSVYTPNVQDFFTFSDDNNSTNVTVPNYDYALFVATQAPTDETEWQQLGAGAVVPTNAVALKVKFTPSANNVFNSGENTGELYTTKTLEVEYDKIVLYESLSDTNFAMFEQKFDQTEATQIEKLELVLNKENGQNSIFTLNGVNNETMKVAYSVYPESLANSINIEQDKNKPNTFRFFGQEETNEAEAYIKFEITYNDPSITSKGTFVLPFGVVSQPDTIAINGNTKAENYALTVYNNYVTQGEMLVVSLSPFSDIYKTVKIYAYQAQPEEDVNPLANNLEWYIQGSTEALHIGAEGLTVPSGTRLYLKNGLNKDGNYGLGTITYVVEAVGADLTRNLNVTLEFGIDNIYVSDNNILDNSTGDFVLALREDATQGDADNASSDAREFSLRVNSGADCAPLLNAFSVADPSIVKVFSGAVDNKGEYQALLKYVLEPLRAGTTTITWTAPTGVTYTQTIRVFNEFYEYSVGLYGQADVVGKVEYKTADTTTTDENGENIVDNMLDKNGQKIISKITVATGSAIEFNNILAPMNAYVSKIEYKVDNASVVKFVGSTTGSFVSAQLHTGDLKGSAVVSCVVTYFKLDSNGNYTTDKTTISFEVTTYYKAKEIFLSDSSITLYATSSSDTSATNGYVYNTDFSQKRITVFVDADGTPDVYTDNAVWVLSGGTSSTDGVIDGLDVKGAIIRGDSNAKNTYYGSNVILTAITIDPSKTKVVYSMQVTLKDYNTVLTATLTITVMAFQQVNTVTFDTTNLQTFRVTKNVQTGANANRTIELYAETTTAGVEDSYFILRPTVRPASATNKNLEYLIFDYNTEGELIARTEQTNEGGTTNFYATQLSSRLLNIVWDENAQAYKIVLNTDATTVRSGKAVVYVMAQSKMKTKADAINSNDQVDKDAILLKIEVVVADGEAEAYRIYNADDYLNIYNQKDKSFVVMNDIYNVDLSAIVNADASFDSTFSGKLSSASYSVTDGENHTPVRTIYFKPITINLNNNTYNNVALNFQGYPTAISLFGDLRGKIENLNFYVPSYTFVNQSADTSNDYCIAYMGVLATQNFGILQNVNLNIQNLSVTETTNSHNSNTICFGAVGQNTGIIKNLSIFANTANFNVTNKIALSLGVGQNEGVIDTLTTAGNVTISGETATEVNFAGAVANNSTKNLINEDLSVNYNVANIESSVNLDAQINLNIVGGVVAVNSGDLYDVRYLSVNDGKSATHGLKLATVGTLGGVVGQNTGKITYAYCAGFVSNEGITVETVENLGGVAGTNSGTIDRVFASITITSNKATNFDEITNGTQATNYYSTCVYNGNPAKSILKSDSDDSIWGNDNSYTGAYYDSNDKTYYFLIKDGNAYLPPVPSRLSSTNPYLIMEYLGSKTEGGDTTYAYNKVDVSLNTKTVTGTGTVAKLDQTNNVFYLFDRENIHGLFVLASPPVDLNKLRIFVTNNNTSVVNVIQGVSAEDYKIQIVGNGTALLTITSALNLEASVTVQICSLNGFASFKIFDADTGAEVNDTINLKKNNPQQFVVNFYGEDGSVLSGSGLQSGVELTGETNLTVTPQNDSFILSSGTTGDYTLTINKTWQANFYNDEQQLTNYAITQNENFTAYNVKVTTGPSAISINHGDLEVYSGEIVYTTVNVVSDDDFSNDTLAIKVGDTQYATITVLGGQATLTTNDDITSKELNFEILSYTKSGTLHTFEIKCSYASPETLLQTINKKITFEASAGSEMAKVSTSYNLTINPQIITSLDMYHYIDVQENFESGSLKSAGEIPTSNFVAGGYGLLKVTLDPSYVNFDCVKIRADLQNNGNGIIFDQRTYNSSGDCYDLYSNSNIQISNNLLVTYKSSFPSDFASTGTLYFRTYLPANTPSSTVFNVYVTVFDNQGNVMIAKSKQYSIYASTALSLSYDNYVAEQQTAFVAQNTGGIEAGDTYGQNANILSVNLQAGLKNPTLRIDGSDTVKLRAFGSTNDTQSIKLSDTTTAQKLQFYVIAKGNLGEKFAITLTAQTYVSGVLTTLTRTMNFEIVDFVVNYQWNNVANSQTLSDAFNDVGGAISNVSGNTWNFVYSTTPVQLSLFVSDKRANRNLLELDTTNNFDDKVSQVLAGLRNIPEFSFDTSNKVLLKKIVQYLQALNINGRTSPSSNSINAFMYEQGTEFKTLDGKVNLAGITLRTGKNDSDSTKYYYIIGKDKSANETLQASIYLIYNTGKFEISTSASNNNISLLYNYQFSISYNSQNSNEHPIPIYNQDDLQKMQAGNSYILLNDITLSADFVPLSTAIASLDGNNYTITLNSTSPFALNSTSGNVGLFAVVDANTILKNVTVKLAGDTTLNCTTEGNLGSYNIGLLAGVNNGTITNCKVVADGKTLTLVSNSQTNTSVVLGGLVGQNAGYITNSRVEEINFATSFAVFGGLVAQNDMLIISSYVNKMTITNNVAQDVDGATVVAGFVANNGSGAQISESYVGGLKVENTDGKITNADTGDRQVTISSNSRFGGFVYDNAGSITDCYSAVNLDNKQTAVASGFVFNNTGALSRVYSVSKPSNSTNTYIRPFTGTTDVAGTKVANNTGSLSYCFYYEPVFNTFQKSAEPASGLSLDGFTNTNNVDQWVGFAFTADADSDNGVWKPLSNDSLGPSLVNANIPGLAEGVKQELESIDTTDSGAVYYYTLSQNGETPTYYNTKDCMALITNAEDFNAIFERSTQTAVCGSDSNYYARVIKPIDLSTLSANNIDLNTINKIFRGTLIGNNMQILGVDVSFLDTATNSESSVVVTADDVKQTNVETTQTEETLTPLPQTSSTSLGLFGEIRGGTVANLTVLVDGVYANNQTRYFVGSLAGRVIDGTLYNLTISGDGATVLGRHIVGGVAGLVQGKSRVSNITANISVTSDFDNQTGTENAYLYNYDLCRMQANTTDINGASGLSVAGGLFGVLDLFDYQSDGTELTYNTKLSETNTNYDSTTLNFVGNNTVLGQIAGGVAGTVGALTVVNDAHTVVYTNTRIKTSVYGGGLVGQNNGTIKYSDVKYTTDVQTLVDSANTGALVDNANSKLFDSISYASAVGGLVGANFGQNYTGAQTGVIRYCSTSVYVDAPTAQNVGGVVGIVFGGDIRAVYATGYVMGYANANVGGLIGTVSEVQPAQPGIINNISPSANIPQNLLVKVNNPYGTTQNLLSQSLLLDFVVAQNNWSSANYTRYLNIQTYGHLGGLVGYATNRALLTTSHNGENFEKDGYTPDMTIVLNYFVNTIPQNPVAVNNLSYNGLKLNAYDYDETNPSIQKDEVTSQFAQGQTRNHAYSTTKWDWFALWDEFCIAGRNGDDTPILQKMTLPAKLEISSTKDFLTMYWNPSKNYELTNNINFVNDDDIQIDYIMVGTKNIPFSGTFDGKGYTISNLKVSNYLANMGGLFGWVEGIDNGNKATIKNLSLANVTLDNAYDASNTQSKNPEFESVGGLAGTIKNATIQDVTILGLRINAVVQNNNASLGHFVGGLAGNADNVAISNVLVEGVDTNFGITITQTQKQNTTQSTLDTLFVGGLLGKAENVTINDNADASWMSVANVSITNKNVYNNTYLGSAIGCVNNTNTYKLIVSGDHKFDGNYFETAELYVGGFYGFVGKNSTQNTGTTTQTTSADLLSSYAYSTIKIPGFTFVSANGNTVDDNSADNVINNKIHLAYDFNFDASANETPINIANFVLASGQTSSEAFEQELKKQQKYFTYNATSIVNNLGALSNANIARYVAYKDYTYKILQGDENESGGSEANTSFKANSYLPIDPYYGLATQDVYYDTTQDDITIAKSFYKNLLSFDNITSENNFANQFGFVKSVETNLNQQIILENALNKIGKLYYVDDTTKTHYGGAQVVGNLSAFNSEATGYYILLADKTLNTTLTSIAENCFINGYNHTVRLTNTTAVANTVSGVLTGIKVEVVANNLNNLTFNGTYGLVADTLETSGEIYACGSYIVQSIGSKKLAYADIAIANTNSSFGGVVGEAKGVVNNCWSHALLNIQEGSGTSACVVGGIVGKSDGATLANLNYYGDICAKYVPSGNDQNILAGILAKAESKTTIFRVLSFVQSSITYHLTPVDKKLYEVYYDADGNLVEEQSTIKYADVTTTISSEQAESTASTTDKSKSTSVYFAVQEDSTTTTTLTTITKKYHGIGTAINLTEVLENIDVRKSSQTEQQTDEAKKSYLFENYRDIWANEKEGVNFDLVYLAVEPEVASTTGITEDDPIAVPDEDMFAQMLDYESSAGNSYCRYYILTKDGNYDLDLITQKVADLRSKLKSSLITVNGATETELDRAFTGHLNGNGKTLEWTSGKTPLPLVSKLVTGDHNGDLMENEEDKENAKPAYIHNLTIVNNSGNAVANIVANEIEKTDKGVAEISHITYKNNKTELKINTTSTGYVQTNSRSNESTARYIGGLVGKNGGTIEYCTIDGLNFNITNASSEAYIGGVVGENSGTIKDIVMLNSKITQTENISDVSTSIRLGGIAGVNSGKILSSNGLTETKSTLHQNELIVFTEDNTTIVLFSDTDYYKSNADEKTQLDKFPASAYTSLSFNKGDYLILAQDTQYSLLSGKFEIYELWEIPAGQTLTLEVQQGQGEIFEIVDKETTVTDEETGDEITKKYKQLSSVTLTADKTYSQTTYVAIVSGTFSFNKGTKISQNTNTVNERTGKGVIIQFSEGSQFSLGDETYTVGQNGVETLQYFSNYDLSSLSIIKGHIDVYYTSTIEHTDFSNYGIYREVKLSINKEGNYQADTALLLYVKGAEPSFDDEVESTVITTAKKSFGNDYLKMQIALVEMNGKARIEDSTVGSFGNVVNGEYYNTDNTTKQSYTILTDVIPSVKQSPTQTSSYIQIGINTPSLSYVGGVAGSNTGTISYVTREGTKVVGNNYVGGVVGKNNGSVYGCNVSGTQVEGTQYVGGIAGQNSGSLQNVKVSKSNISATNTDGFVGGIAGSNQNGEYKSADITNFNVVGSTVTGNNHASGVAGYNNGLIKVESNINAQISGTTINVTAPYSEDNTTTNFYVGYVTNENYGEIAFQGNLSITNDSKMSLNLDSYSDKNPGDLYVSVGGVTGVNERVISAMNITAYQAWTSEGISIKESFLKFELTGNVEACSIYAYVGGVAGHNKSSIRNVGDVAINISTSNGFVLNNIYTLNVGGVTGKNDGNISGTGRPTDSVLSNIDLSSADYVGGITALNSEDSAIYNIRFYGTINVAKINNNEVTVTGVAQASINGAVGGVVALNDGVIFKATYSGTTTVTTGMQTGGIAGKNTQTGVIATCVTGGTVSGQDYVGGFVGYNQGQISDSKQFSSDTTLTADNIFFADNAVVKDNSAINIKVYNTKIDSIEIDHIKQTYEVGIPNGATITVYASNGTVQTTKNDDTVSVKFLTDARVKIGNNVDETPCKKDSEIGGNVTYVDSALVEITNKTEGLITLTFTGEIFVEESSISFKDTATFDGMFKTEADNISFGINSGSIYDLTSSSKQPTTGQTSQYSKYALNGTATYQQNATVDVVGEQKYLQDTTSNIKGTLKHTNGTTVTMGQKIKKNDEEGNTTYSYEYTTETYPSKTTITYPKDSDTDPNDYAEITINLPTDGLGITINFGSETEVVAGGRNCTGSSGNVGYVCLDDGTQWQFGTDQTLSSGTYTFTSSILKEGDKIIYTVYAVTFLLKTQATITYPAGTSVQVFGKQRYDGDTTSSIEGFVKHTQNTTVTMELEEIEQVDENNQPTGSYTYEYTTETYTSQSQIYYPNDVSSANSTEVTVSKNKTMTFTGIQKFLDDTYSIIDGTLCYLNDSTNIKIYTEVYIDENNQYIKTEEPDNHSVNKYDTQIFDNTQIVFHPKGTVVSGYIVIKTSESLSDTQSTVKEGAKVTYGADCTETYGGDTNVSSTINGTVTYTSADTMVEYPAGTTVTYLAETTIFVRNSFNISINDSTINLSAGDFYAVSANTSVTFDGDAKITYNKSSYAADDTVVYKQQTSLVANSNFTISVVSGSITDQENTYTSGEIAITSENTFTISENTKLKYLSSANATANNQSKVQYNNTTVVHVAGKTLQFSEDSTETYLQDCTVTYNGQIKAVEGLVYTEEGSYNITSINEVVEASSSNTNYSKSSKLTITGSKYVGGAIGYNEGGSVCNIQLNNVTINTLGGSEYVGGFVGLAEGSPTGGFTYGKDDMDKAYTVTEENFVGYHEYNNKQTISGCSVNNVTISNGGGYALYVGGFAGALFNVEVDGCGVTGTVNIDAGHTIGGFAGQTAYGHNNHNKNEHYSPTSVSTLTNCYMTNISGTLTSYTNNENCDPLKEHNYEGSGDVFNAILVVLDKSNQDENLRNLDEVVGHTPNGEVDESNCNFADAYSLVLKVKN